MFPDTYVFHIVFGSSVIRILNASVPTCITDFTKSHLFPLRTPTCSVLPWLCLVGISMRPYPYSFHLFRRTPSSNKCYQHIALCATAFQSKSQSIHAVMRMTWHPILFLFAVLFILSYKCLPCRFSSCHTLFISFTTTQPFVILFFRNCSVIIMLKK
jgi:hypothetical protein